jgi:hydrogenase maturation protein HypF
VPRYRIVIEGIVQGVGFRPFVKQLADQLTLAGTVVNTAGGLVIEIDSTDGRQPRQFLDALRARAPAASLIESVTVEECDCDSVRTGFFIAQSAPRDSAFTLTSPDLATCPQCVAEIRDPTDRRFGYPFNNCTNCGPRYSITVSTPYDRATTTMAKFTMCAKCAAEYGDTGDRRFHAEPIACPVCGPQLSFPITEALDELRRGRILALKGLGGFQLACDAFCATAVQKLRLRKRRSRKPLAVMVRDLPTVERYFLADEADCGLLTDRVAPIVLLAVRDPGSFPYEIAFGLPHFGVMLPYTPLHHLLLGGGADCLIMTSGNMSDEPIVTDNKEAVAVLSPIADRVLTHNREIFMRVDDSIARNFEGLPRILRRARGYTPRAIRLPHPGGEVLGVGAELKNTFCITKGDYAIPSQHLGDLENYETLRFFQETLQNLLAVYQAKPRLIVHDLHPDYLSTRWALARPEPKFAVQHHHAHVASCMAENGLRNRVIGVAFDGTGFGADGQIWGGEFLIADYRGFERRAHLRYVALPGGDSAAKQGWRMAAAHLYDALGADYRALALDCWKHLSPASWNILQTLIERPSVWTSSCGRLFDSIAAICGISPENTYEGESAMLLEAAARSWTGDGAYMMEIDFQANPWMIDTRPMLRQIAADIKAHSAIPGIARRFHNGLASTIESVCSELRKREEINDVCLSGGTFQNWTLLEGTVARLRRGGFQVYLHSRVPPNDGGISLGQAAIGAAFCER